MTDRRQHRRFVLDQPLTGELQISVDVTLDHIGERGATVLTRTPLLTREPVALRLMTVGGQVHDMMVRVFRSLPVTVDGTMWQRIECEQLAYDSGHPDRPNTPPRLEDLLTSVVVRRVKAYVLQVSANGCLLETPLSLDHVRFARLDVQGHGGGRYGAMVRVCRPGTRVTGSSLSHVAAEFVPLYESTDRSIQQFVALHEDAGAR